MSRRFVNLVVASGSKNPMYSLHRLDISKHLFYPSTDEAEAANMKNADNNNGGKPPRIEKLRRLPAPSMRLQMHLNRVRGATFSLLRQCGDDGEAGRILHTNEEGHALLCDVHSCSTKTMPCLNLPKGSSPISFTVPGTGPDEESIYLMCSVPRHDYSFEVLHLRGESPEQNSRRRRFDQPPRPRLNWQPLPPLLLAADPYNDPWPMESSALLDDGRIIAVSTFGNPLLEHRDQGMGEGTGTYCFDTESQEWWHAGNWALPFDGRAVHVPELHTWLGFSPGNLCRLCAVDLSGVAMAPRHAPRPTHVWEDFSPPPTEDTSFVLNKRFPGIVHRTIKEWLPTGLDIVNLGSGRFCIAKVISVQKTVLPAGFDEDWTIVAEYAVLTGVQVVRGSEGELRMIKHKSKCYEFSRDRIKCVL